MTVSSPTKRVEGLDFARALALFGMLIVNFAVITGVEGKGSDWLIRFTGIFQGRAAAAFVMLAGIGVALMTRKVRNNASPASIRSTRLDLWKRSAFLLVSGLLLYAVGWTGDILHYYGVYMFIAAFLITVPRKVVIVAASGVVIMAQTMQVTFNYMNGWHPEQPFMEYLDFWTVEGFLRNLLFNGYHPVFPWICFFLIGMVIGRLDLSNPLVRKKLLVTSLLSAIIVESLSRILLQTSLSVLDVESAEYLFQTGPVPPNLFYILSNSSTALVVIILSVYFAERFAGHWFTNAIVNTGQMTLTHYVSHVLIGIGLLSFLNRLQNQSLAFSLLFSCLFFAASILFSVLWKRKFTRGPMELLMRKIC
ncbi:membrane protein [Paenibacillus albidus]|uniref:Membrane protein n=1 Tax=Paenibacillus albidus TaxID=2041023 RepID=A0A917C2A9_9BACL|nr:heparan-alpha-glucosaminide N-acetyltransferase domain-containing protein [Paenibacillus albidus]GGF68866.1 membrane protein [Paenibacillus albidus]